MSKANREQLLQFLQGLDDAEIKRLNEEGARQSFIEYVGWIGLVLGPIWFCGTAFLFGSAETGFLGTLKIIGVALGILQFITGILVMTGILKATRVFFTAQGIVTVITGLFVMAAALKNLTGPTFVFGISMIGVGGYILSQAEHWVQEANAPVDLNKQKLKKARDFLLRANLDKNPDILEFYTGDTSSSVRMWLWDQRAFVFGGGVNMAIIDKQRITVTEPKKGFLSNKEKASLGLDGVTVDVKGFADDFEQLMHWMDPQAKIG